MTEPLGVGERAPDFVLPRKDGTPTRFYGAAGGAPTVLWFTAGDAEGPELDQPGVHVFVVLGGAARTAGAAAGLALLDGGEVAHAYGLDPAGAAVAFLLDANLRVHARLDRPSADQVTANLPAPHADDGEVRAQAPVLLVPGVLDEAECAELIALWQHGGNVETGVERSGTGDRADAVDPQSKRRRDHTVTDPDRLRALSRTIGRRVMPELRKAFAYRATRFEGFKIARYDDAAGGFFAAHRDNLSPATAHRRFALTLNLNAGYEGGHLRFPEYGAQRYRPAAGEALLFSCAHLHEVLPVSAGQRFVLLSFLFGEEQRRQAG